MPIRCCLARLVSPSFRPASRSPRASRRRSVRSCTAYPVTRSRPGPVVGERLPVRPRLLGVQQRRGRRGQVHRLDACLGVPRRVGQVRSRRGRLEHQVRQLRLAQQPVHAPGRHLRPQLPGPFQAFRCRVHPDHVPHLDVLAALQLGQQVRADVARAHDRRRHRAHHRSVRSPARTGRSRCPGPRTPRSRCRPGRRGRRRSPSPAGSRARPPAPRRGSRPCWPATPVR